MAGAAGEGPALNSDPPDLEAIAEKALSILVETFDFPEAEARHRLTLWKAKQHDLAGQALGVLLPGMNQDERDAALLKWALEGLFLERDLRTGAAKLGIDLAESEPISATPVGEARQMLSQREPEPEDRPPR